MDHLEQSDVELAFDSVVLADARLSSDPLLVVDRRALATVIDRHRGRASSVDDDGECVALVEEASTLLAELVLSDCIPYRTAEVAMQSIEFLFELNGKGLRWRQADFHDLVHRIGRKLATHDEVASWIRVRLGYDIKEGRRAFDAIMDMVNRRRQPQMMRDYSTTQALRAANVEYWYVR